MRRQGIRLDLVDDDGAGTLLLDRRRRAWHWWALLSGVGFGLAWVLLFRDRADAGGPDVVALQDRVLGFTGDARVEVRHLGDGIVELVGEVDAPDIAGHLVESLADEPGVSAVLDRLWVRPPRLVS